MHLSVRTPRTLLLAGFAILFSGFTLPLAGSGGDAPPAELTKQSAVCKPVPGAERAMLDRGCAADISYPIDLSVELIDEARPGRRVEARVEFESRVRLENVSIRVIPTAGLGLRTPAQTNVGLLTRGQRNSHSLQVDLPQDTKRRTVEVTVEGYTDGHKLSRSAILNLLPGGGESFRIVNTADGRRIREVPAKRVN